MSARRRGSGRSIVSGCIVVFVDQAAEEVTASELRMRWYSQRRRAAAYPFGWPKCERAVRPMPLVMTGVDAKHVLELAAAEDEQPVEALATHNADPALGVGVRIRRMNGACRSRRCLHSGRHGRSPRRTWSRDRESA